MAAPAANEPGSTKVRVERVGGVPTRFIASVAIVVGALAVALVKPWGGTAPVRDQTAPGFDFASPTPSPGGDPALAAAQLRAQCNQPPVWRLITMETSMLGDTRTMYGILPATASGPTDASIPAVDLHADRLFGIGICSPFAGANPTLPGPVIGVTIWGLSPTGEPSRFDQTPALDELGEAYFGPPRTETDPLVAGNHNPTWPPGRYVIQIDRGDAQGATLWFALEFVPQPVR